MLKVSAPQKRIRRGSCCFFAVAAVLVLENLAWMCFMRNESTPALEQGLRGRSIFIFIFFGVVVLPTERE